MRIRKFEMDYGRWRGRPCYEMYKDRKEPCLNCAAAMTFEDGKVRIREEKGRVGEGSPTDYLVHMVPIRGPLGKIRFIVEMSTDITEVKKLEAEKREAERLAAVGETVAGIAHGIKNVLMGLEGGMYAVNSGHRDGGRRPNRPGLDHPGGEREADLRVREGVPGLRQGSEDHRRHGGSERSGPGGGGPVSGEGGPGRSHVGSGPPTGPGTRPPWTRMASTPASPTWSPTPSTPAWLPSRPGRSW